MCVRDFSTSDIFALPASELVAEPRRELEPAGPAADDDDVMQAVVGIIGNTFAAAGFISLIAGHLSLDPTWPLLHRRVAGARSAAEIVGSQCDAARTWQRKRE